MKEWHLTSREFMRIEKRSSYQSLQFDHERAHLRAFSFWLQLKLPTKKKKQRLSGDTET